MDSTKKIWKIDQKPTKNAQQRPPKRICKFYPLFSHPEPQNRENPSRLKDFRGGSAAPARPRVAKAMLSNHHRTASPDLRAAAPAADPGQKKRWTWCCRRSSRNSRHPRTQLVCLFLEFQEVWLWPAYWGLLNKYLLMKGSRWHSLHCLNTWQNNWSIVQVVSRPFWILVKNKASSAAGPAAAAAGAVAVVLVVVLVCCYKPLLLLVC